VDLSAFFDSMSELLQSIRLNNRYGGVSTEIHYTDPDRPWIKGELLLMHYDFRNDRHFDDHFIVG
jgi:hypothetical protein